MRAMTDSHFHALAMRSKGVDPAESIAAARKRGFCEAIEIGLHPSDLAERMILLGSLEQIHYSSGFAPAEARSQIWREHIGLLREQALSGHIVAIGELGLDWHWNYGSKEAQIELMSAQLDLAAETQLPVIIHNRDADSDVLNILRNSSLPAAGIMHCFSSGYKTAATFVDLGYLISFAGNVTYKGANDIQEAARKLPGSSILVETDSPFLSPQAVRGAPNTPEHICHTYEFLAELRGAPIGCFTEMVRRNLLNALRINHQE